MSWAAAGLGAVAGAGAELQQNCFIAFREAGVLLHAAAFYCSRPLFASRLHPEAGAVILGRAPGGPDMLTPTLLLALSLGGPTAGWGDPGEATLPVPTYASPPHFVDRALLDSAGRWVVVVKGPGGREVRHSRVRVEQTDGWSFEVRVAIDRATGKGGLQLRVLRQGQ
jgi:hypothetical protein